MEVGLLLLRFVTGSLLAGHGAQKLFGWFGGHGLRGTAGFVESLGWRPGRRFAALLGLAELAGGAALALGLGTPLAAGVIVAVMLNAAWFAHRDKGLWNTEGGYEYPLTLASVAVALGITGAGRYSLDHALGWSLAGPRGAAIALGLGVAGWLAGAAARHRRDHGSGGQTPAEPGEPAGTDQPAGAAAPLGAGAVAPPRPRHEVIVLLDDLDKAAARALGYARTLRPLAVTALHVAVDPDHARALAEQWARLGLDVPLEVISCPDRDLPSAVRQALTERMRPDTAVTVLIPNITTAPCSTWRCTTAPHSACCTPSTTSTTARAPCT
jgi:putative oxidoreductase